MCANMRMRKNAIKTNFFPQELRSNILFNIINVDFSFGPIPVLWTRLLRLALALLPKQGGKPEMNRQ